MVWDVFMFGRLERMHQRFLIDLHSILENTKPNSADYDSAVTDLADTVFTSGDYEDVLDYIERLLMALLDQD